MRFFLAFCFLFALAADGRAGSARELSRPLREASELHRSLRLDEARALALSVHRAFPRDIEPLLLLGRIDLDAGRLAAARTWIRLASVAAPRHPLVLVYRRLFEAWEHRHGPLTHEYLPLPAPDPYLTARRFRRGWFGPALLATDPRVDPTPVLRNRRNGRSAPLSPRVSPRASSPMQGRVTPR